MPSKDDIIAALKTVMDPEIHMDVWTLGLIYEIELKGDEAYVKMTFTTPFCPYGPALAESVRRAILGVKGVKNVDLDIVFEPPWTPSEELKVELGLA